MIEIGNLLIDFGLVILVFIVQLVIYPSFKYYSFSEIKIWHPIYTRRFSTIVMPLMLMQLGFAIYFLLLDINLYSIGNLSLIIMIWLITFLKAIPIHANITTSENFKSLIRSLIRWNSWRCLLWVSIFVWSIVLFYL